MSSITRLLGESFKLHSQALMGYEDALAAGSGASTPISSAPEVQMMQTAVAV